MNDNLSVVFSGLFVSNAQLDPLCISLMSKNACNYENDESARKFANGLASAMSRGAVGLAKIQMGYQEAPLDDFSPNSPFTLLRVELDICRILLEEYHEPVFALSTGLFGIL